LTHAPERTHLQFVELLGRKDLARPGRPPRPSPRRAHQNRRRQLVARLVHQRTCKVLALAHNHALGKRSLQRILIGVAGSQNSDRLNAQVFAVTAIGVRVKSPTNAPSTTARTHGPGGSRALSSAAKTTSRIPRGLANRITVPAALRTPVTVALACFPSPQSPTVSPSGRPGRAAAASRLRLPCTLHLPALHQRRIDRFVRGQKNRFGLGAGAFEIWVSTAITASSSVSIPAGRAKRQFSAHGRHYFT